MTNIGSVGSEYYRGNMPQLELFNLNPTSIMKFTVQRNTLLAALSATGKAIGRSTVPIMECYRIAVSGNSASITGSNYEVFFRQEIEVKSEIELLNICVESEKLLSYIKSIPDQPLDFVLHTKEDADVPTLSLEVIHSSGKPKMVAFPGEHYPDFPESGEVSYKVPAAEFFDGVSRTLFAVEQSDNTAVSNYLIRMGSGINPSGCSSPVVSTMSVFKNTVNKADIILSKSCAAALTGIGYGDEISLSYTPKNFIIENTEGFKASFIRVDAEFAKFEAMLDIPDTNHFICNPREFEAALKRVMVFTSKFTREIKINATADGVVIETINETEETCREFVSAEVVGEIAIGFNCDYVFQAIQRIKSEACQFNFTVKSKPLLITEVQDGESDIKILLAPVNLNW